MSHCHGDFYLHLPASLFLKSLRRLSSSKMKLDLFGALTRSSYFRVCPRLFGLVVKTRYHMGTGECDLVLVVHEELTVESGGRRRRRRSLFTT